MNAQNLQFSYGDDNIAFRLERRRRKTLAISVKPDLSVEVVAPLDASLEKVFEKVKKRAPWIRRQLRFFTQFQPRTPPRQYIGGETHLYLGRQYRLKVVPHIQQHVKLFRGLLIVQSPKPKDKALTRDLVEQWYRERAQSKFRERVDIARRRFPKPEEFAPTGLVVRQLAQRWGSMTPEGKLILNRSLIRSSVDAIDYVITHELCHLRHNHHGAEFFALLDRVMPDWQKRKAKLERQLA
jgi:predicted metal-dependent hydrolase